MAQHVLVQVSHGEQEQRLQRFPAGSRSAGTTVGPATLRDRAQLHQLVNGAHDAKIDPGAGQQLLATREGESLVGTQ